MKYSLLTFFTLVLFSMASHANITYFFDNSPEDPPVVRECKKRVNHKWCAGTCCDLSTNECCGSCCNSSTHECVSDTKCCKKAGPKSQNCTVIENIDGCDQWVDKKCPNGQVCHMITEQCVDCYWDSDCSGNKTKCDKTTNTCVCGDNSPTGFDPETCKCPTDMAEVELTNEELDEVKACWPYCGELNTGLVLLIDRSNSTSPGKNGLYKYINAALNVVQIPYDSVPTAIYFEGRGKNATVLTNPVPYGMHSYDDLSPYFNQTSGFVSTDTDATNFYPSLNDIAQNVCKGQKLIMVLWTDGELSSTKTGTYLSTIKEKCPGSKLFLIAPSTKTWADEFYNIKNTPESYITFLNNFIKQEGCVTRD